MQYTVTFDSARLRHLMDALRQELESPQEMLGSFGETLLRINRERHRQGIAPDGTPWAKLKHPEGKRKGGPLNRSGRMLANFHYQVTGDTLRLGFDDGDGYPAKFHQEGSIAHIIAAKNKKALAFMGIVRKRVKHPGLPARLLVGFPTSDQRLIEEVAQDHLEAVMNRI
ncbi:MAG: phage virion morphogenesis protein [Zoogloeaceae bacterium]|jgi:phage gpG-like protein|nr:phage virion morphogenesis protein [Zoogloeaceae bacterium]